MVREDGSVQHLPKDSITTILPEIKVESPVNKESILSSEQEANVCSQNPYNIYKIKCL